MQIKILNEFRKPITFSIDGPITITLDPTGKLWINGEESCIVRFCQIPKESLVTFHDKGIPFLDVTINRKVM